MHHVKEAHYESLWPFLSLPLQLTNAHILCHSEWFMWYPNTLPHTHSVMVRAQGGDITLITPGLGQGQRSMALCGSFWVWRHDHQAPGDCHYPPREWWMGTAGCTAPASHGTSRLNSDRGECFFCPTDPEVCLGHSFISVCNESWLLTVRWWHELTIDVTLLLRDGLTIDITLLLRDRFSHCWWCRQAWYSNTIRPECWLLPCDMD